MTGSNYRWDLARAAMMIVVVFIIYRLLVPASSDSPLNDDWAYAQSVRHLLDTGELRVTDWATAALIPQIFWGALFVELSGGFSFVALHFSALVFCAISALAFYALLRQLNQRHAAALLGTLLLLVNPLFVNLAYTFLTDIFFLGLILISLTLYLRGFGTNSNRMLLLASLVAALSYLERQIGVVLPIAAALTLILRRRSWTTALAASVLPLGVLVAHQLWMSLTNTMPWATRLIAINAGPDFLLHGEAYVTIFLRCAWSLLYLGLFTLPLLVARWGGPRQARVELQRWLKAFGFWTIGLLIPVAFAIATTGQSLPYLANIINHGGLGALTLLGERPLLLPAWLFWLLTILAPFAGAAWAATLTTWLWSRPHPVGDLLMMLTAGGMALLSVAFVLFFDRYLLTLLPLAIYIALRQVHINRLSLAVGLGLSFFLAVFSLYGTADYLAWTAARWATAQQLVTSGIPPSAIDGGIEWVGWHEFETALPLARASGLGDDQFAWMKLTPKTYRLAFSPLSGYTVGRIVNYARPLFTEPGQIYVLQQP